MLREESSVNIRRSRYPTAFCFGPMVRAMDFTNGLSPVDISFLAEIAWRRCVTLDEAKFLKTRFAGTNPSLK